VSLKLYGSFMNTSFLTSCGNAEGLKLMLLTLASQEPIHQAEVGGKTYDGEALHRFKGYSSQQSQLSASAPNISRGGIRN